MSDDQSLTWAELEAQSNRLAHLLRALGLRRGDHIAWVIENRLEFFVLAWAAQRAGLYYTPCSTRLRTTELEYIVNDSGASVLIASDATVEPLETINAPGVRHRLLLSDENRDGWDSLMAATGRFDDSPIPDQAEGSDFLYSSGTTGRPKGIARPLTRRPFPAATNQGLRSLYGFTEETVYLSPAPLYHSGPIRFCMTVLRGGGTVVVQESFDPEEFLSLIDRHQVTFTQVVPTMFIRMLKLPDVVKARYDLSSLVGAVHGAAPCPVEVKERMIDWWGPIIHEFYGGTEGNGFVLCDSHEWLQHRGTVGRALAGNIRILNDQGEELPAGETGLIYFEGSGFEYHGDPEKTAASLDPKGRGWSTLGDIGHLDNDGFLYLTDRKAHMIISGGVNVYPQEAENALALHPAVEDIAVFGIPHPDMGEAVHAVVQPTPGHQPDDTLARELIDYCRTRIAAYKCPRTIDFRDELPRLPTGKLAKTGLKAEYWNE